MIASTTMRPNATHATRASPSTVRSNSPNERASPFRYFWTSFVAHAGGASPPSSLMPRTGNATSNGSMRTKTTRKMTALKSLLTPTVLPPRHQRMQRRSLPTSQSLQPHLLDACAFFAGARVQRSHRHLYGSSIQGLVAFPKRSGIA